MDAIIILVIAIPITGAVRFCVILLAIMNSLSINVTRHFQQRNFQGNISIVVESILPNTVKCQDIWSVNNDQVWSAFEGLHER